MLAKNLFMLKRRHYFVIMFSTDALKFVCLFFLRRNIFTVVLNFGCHEQSISINSNRCIFSNVRQTMIFFFTPSESNVSFAHSISSFMMSLDLEVQVSSISDK